MNEIVQMLDKLANNASFTCNKKVTELLNNAPITATQYKAVTTKDVELLAESTKELSKIKYIIPLIPAEDDEPEESEQDNTNTDSTAQLASSF